MNPLGKIFMRKYGVKILTCDDKDILTEDSA